MSGRPSKFDQHPTSLSRMVTPGGEGVCLSKAFRNNFKFGVGAGRIHRSISVLGLSFFGSREVGLFILDQRGFLF